MSTATLPPTPPERATIAALMVALQECFTECACLRYVTDPIDREHAHKAYAYAHSALTVARALLDPMPVIHAEQMHSDPATERVLAGGGP